MTVSQASKYSRQFRHKLATLKKPRWQTGASILWQLRRRICRLLAYPLPAFYRSISSKSQTCAEQFRGCAERNQISWNRIGGTENHSQARNTPLFSLLVRRGKPFIYLKADHVHEHVYVTLTCLCTWTLTAIAENVFLDTEMNMLIT